MEFYQQKSYLVKKVSHILIKHLAQALKINKSRNYKAIIHIIY